MVSRINDAVKIRTFLNQQGATFITSALTLVLCCPRDVCVFIAVRPVIARFSRDLFGRILYSPFGGTVLFSRRGYGTIC